MAHPPRVQVGLLLSNKLNVINFFQVRFNPLMYKCALVKSHEECLLSVIHWLNKIILDFYNLRKLSVR